MVRYDDSRCTCINRMPSVITGEYAFDNNRPTPKVMNPAQVFPSDSSVGQSCSDIDKRHGSLTRDDNVGQMRQSAIKQEADKPPRTDQQLRQKGNLVQQSLAQ